jgi:hypothetical protein
MRTRRTRTKENWKDRMWITRNQRSKIRIRLRRRRETSKRHEKGTKGKFAKKIKKEVDDKTKEKESKSGKRIKDKAGKNSKRSDETRLRLPSKGEKEQTEGRRSKRGI